MILQSESDESRVVSAEKTFELQRLQKSLGANRVLIEFVNYKNRFAAFVVRADALEFVDELGDQAEIQQLLEAVRFQFGALRYPRADIEKHLPQLTKRILVYLQKLYDQILLPLEHLVADKHLIVVPTANLHYVPFAALHDGEQFLIEKHAVIFAPSAPVLQR